MYPLRSIFTDLLEHTEKKSFLIPTYQRGYKWTSLEENSQVEQLMKDLLQACLKKKARYYLQFITVKENGDSLEIIDGQQRLTTLTILFSVFAHLKILEEDSFVKNKLDYQVRANFLQRFVYTDLGDILAATDWNAFLDAHDSEELNINNQDVYFIFHATKAMDRFIQLVGDEGSKLNFFKYICEKVYLIVNPLEQEMNSEKIFINVNKGVKLKDEDLVKALLITKIPLDNTEMLRHQTENEINEIRANVGRQWDEIVRWASRDDIKTFFNVDQGENSLAWVISLSYPDALKIKDQYPFFMYIDELKSERPLTIFNKIRATTLKLDDWFSEPEISNLLGYILHAKKSQGLRAIWTLLKECHTKSEVLRILKTKCKELLPVEIGSNKLSELNYDDHKTELFNLFLMLDVARFLPIGGRIASKYDFEVIVVDNWSIEHIFPQTAQDFKEIEMLSSQDLLIIKQLLPDQNMRTGIELENDETIKSLYQKIMASENECLISKEERNGLSLLLKKNAPDLHKLGNLALLKQEMNASLSNHYFDGKRKIIVKKVGQGAFVPFHTYDVFSKLIINSNTSLHIWSKDDIVSHEAYICNQMQAITNYLTV
jgi:hypothetical protein